MPGSPNATLLVVDDQPANVRALYEAFANDYQVLMATHGEQALDICRAHHPDLVLLDVVMPKMDGHAVCRALQNDPDTSDIPVIFVTSHNDPEEEALGLELGAVDFIAKPVNPAVVRSRVKTHISLKRANAAMREALREKETLLNEVYHRVKNNLHVVSSLLNLQLRSLADSSARAAITESIERVSAMALVHEKLLQSTNLSSIALADYVLDLSRMLQISAGLSTRNIAVTTEIEPVNVGMETAVPLGLLINELVTNSVKHAFPDGRCGTVLIKFWRENDAMYVLQVADDGVGRAMAASDRTVAGHLGIKLVKALAGQIDGQVSTTHHGGTSTRIEFPLRPSEVPAQPTSKAGTLG